MIKFLDLLKEIKINQPFQYKKAHGENHSYKEYLDNDKHADNFLIDKTKEKIIAGFTGWNIPKWARNAEKTNQNLKIVSKSAITNPPPYLDLPNIEINNPNSWEASNISTLIKNVD